MDHSAVITCICVWINIPGWVLSQFPAPDLILIIHDTFHMQRFMPKIWTNLVLKNHQIIIGNFMQYLMQFWKLEFDLMYI